MQYISKMEEVRWSDDIDQDNAKGCIQGVVHRTAAYLDERCRYDRPSGPVNTPSRGAPINKLVERGVECGPAQLVSAALRVVPIGNSIGKSSTIGAQRGASQRYLEHRDFLQEQLRDQECPISYFSGGDWKGQSTPEVQYSLSQAEDSQDFFSDEDRERYQTGSRTTTPAQRYDGFTEQPIIGPKRRRGATRVTTLPDMEETTVSLAARQPIEEPLDLRTHTRTVESDVVDRIHSITRDISDLCVEDLSVASARRSRTEFIQTTCRLREGNQDYSGGYNFNISLQDDELTECCSVVLEREDGYIHGSQPCKYNFTRSTTEGSVSQPELRMEARRRVRDDCNSTDASPAKRRYEETSVDDAFSTTTTVWSHEEEPSDVQYRQLTFHARMMNLDDETYSEVERRSEVGSSSAGRSSHAEAESVLERETRGEHCERSRAVDFNTIVGGMNQMDDGLQMWTRMLQEERDQLQRLRVLNQSLPSTNGKPNCGNGESTSAKASIHSPLRQLYREPTVITSNVEPVPLDCLSRLEYLKGSRQEDRIPLTRQNIEKLKPPVEDRRADVEPLWSDHGTNSGRSTASLLDAVTRLAQGEVIDTTRHGERQKIAYMRQKSNAVTSSGGQLPYIFDSRAEQPTPDSSRRHTWNTVDSEIHVRRDTVKIDPPRVLSEPLIRCNRLSEGSFQLSSSTGDQNRFRQLARSRENDEEHYLGFHPPPKFAAPLTHLQGRQLEINQNGVVVLPRGATLSSGKEIDGSNHTDDIGVRRRKETSDFYKPRNFSNQRATRESDGVSNAKTRPRELEQRETNNNTPILSASERKLLLRRLLAQEIAAYHREESQRTEGFEERESRRLVESSSDDDTDLKKKHRRSRIPEASKEYTRGVRGLPKARKEESDRERKTEKKSAIKPGRVAKAKRVDGDPSSGGSSGDDDDQGSHHRPEDRDRKREIISEA